MSFVFQVLVISHPCTVSVSGVPVSQNIIFSINIIFLSSSLTGFTLLNDSIALETVERYSLSLVGHYYTAEPNRVTLGPDSRLSIIDDDGIIIIYYIGSLYVGMRGIFQDGGRFGNFQTLISLLSYFLWPYNWLS